MSNIKLNRKTFEKEIGKLDEKMQEKIALFGTPVESLTENELELEIFPNRPDLLSYQGFKRSFLAFLGKKTGLKKYKLKKPEKNFQVTIDSSTKSVRPFTACAIIKGLKLNDERIKEIIEIQEKLHNTIGRKRKKAAIGIYPLEKIKLPITYLAIEPDKIRFTPLEAGKEMSGLEILQRHPAGRDYAHLLAGKSKFPVFIDSEKQVLSMPPIINSDLTGRIDSKTKNIFIEVSGFDYEILKKTLNILVTTLSHMNGKIYQMQIKGGKEKISPTLETKKMKISISNTNKLLGLNLNEKELKFNLEKMGYKYFKGEVEIPSFRNDILHEVDLIEDVAISYGYENFEPVVPKVSGIGKISKTESIKQKISEILTGLNFLEVSNYHLTKKEDQFRKMGILKKQEKDFVEVIESKTDFNILRKDLTHYLLKNFSENIDSEYPQKIFETGIVFKPEKQESENLSLGIAPGNFTEIKQVIEYLFRMLDLKIEIKEPDKFPSHFIDGRVAEISLNERKIGFVGEIHPRILKNFKIKMPVSLAEISLKDLFGLLSQ